MRKQYKRLSLEELQRIHQMHSWSRSVGGIARELKRAASTISRALRRHNPKWYVKLYSPYDRAKHDWDETLKKRRERRRRRRLKNLFIEQYVSEKLEGGLSPELISGRLKIEHPQYSISYEAIYQWIFRERREYARYLLRAGKRERRGKPGVRLYPRRLPSYPKKSIMHRPKEAELRLEIGHKESDLILSSKNESSLLVLVDRYSRKVWLRKVVNRKAETVQIALASVLRTIPTFFRHTLTQDNGAEHALFLKLQEETGVRIFFCHPYCAWERGTVENRNGMIRRYFPKGTDFATVSNEQIRWVEQFINSRPMKILNFLTPDEVYFREVSKYKA